MSALKKKTAVIISVSSDIGYDLAKRYLKAGYRVVGTYRSQSHVQSLRKHRDCRLFSCDLTQRKSIEQFLQGFKELGWSWDVFVSSVGMPQPLTAFFKTDFDAWMQSVHVNSIEQLRILHGLYPMRKKKAVSDVVFFAAGGTNNAVVNLSAYTISKIMLIKMCEFLDAETPDLNIFIVGPGWTKTKIHHTILADSKISRDKRKETQKFIRTQSGTSLAEIFACIEWLRRHGKPVASGRNFSVVHDPWKGPKADRLAAMLKSNPGMFKLRRHLNEVSDYVQK